MVKISVGDAVGLKLRTLPLALAVALHGTAALAELPVPSANFINPGQGLAVMQSDGVNMVINQQSDRVILNWEQFNVGSGNTVTYNQPSTGSVALNRIFQSDPSKILGAINANGQVYLYNQNGIIFGEGSKINVGSLVATTLNVDDSQFLQGALTNAIENGEAAFFDITGDNKGIIEIQPGAEINANDPNGGRILIIAPEIINGGTLSSPDGQTILAASSDKVYLAASDKDPNLRGLLVEVKTGGSVTNLGSVLADRGNITMIGLAVNQSGRMRATTSVSKNGSIRLLARDNAIVKDSDTFSDDESLQAIGIENLASKPTASKLAVAQNAGSVNLGSGSVTEVVPDDDTVTAVSDAQEQLQSKVEIVGKEIWLQPDASIVAPSGKVKITATSTPATTTSNAIDDSSYVYLDTGSSIDVSGTDTTVLEMERNSLAVEVRANELAGSPLQRGGVLQGQTIYVDLSRGTEIIDYSGALANVEKTVSERLVSGGDIEIMSAGDVLQLDGSVLDISGGTITYNDGFIKESQLISDNRVYDLSQADKNRSYDAILGVETVNHDRWGVTETFTGFSGLDSGRYVDSFVEGRDAGNINIKAAAVMLAADGVKADVTVGPYQLDPVLMPEGGALDIDTRSLIGSTQGVSFLAEVLVDEITGEMANAPDPMTLQRLAITDELVLPDSYLQHSGLGTLRIDSNGAILISDSAAVNALADSTIALTGSEVNINGRITSHSGEVALRAQPVFDGNRANLTIGDNAVIDTTGLWINETETAAVAEAGIADTAHLIDGGSISLQAEGDITVAKGSLLNASAGALLDADYKVNAGKGGDISLRAIHRDGSAIDLQGELQSYALLDGGSLELEAASIYVGDVTTVPVQPNQLVLAPAFFERGGFNSYTLTANAGDLVVDSVITPLMHNLIFTGGEVLATNASSAKPSLEESILLAPTGSNLQSMADVAVLSDEQRQAVDLELNLQQAQTDKSHNLTISDKAVINLDTAASLTLDSDTGIHMAGIINAPAGNVQLNIKQPGKETGFLANQGIWLAAGSQINARSTAVLTANDQSLRLGVVYDAGSVTLAADRGYVIIQDGASIDVSADAVTLDMLLPMPGAGAQYQAVEVAPDAGNISLSAAEGIIIDGDLHADAAAVSGASGGQLALAIDIDSRGINYSGNATLGSSGLVKFNFDSRDIVIAAEAGDRLSPLLQPGDNIDSSLNGKAYLDAAKVERAGFDSLTLDARHVVSDQVASYAASEIRFESDVQLNLGNAIVLHAPTVNIDNHDVSLAAPYINLGTDSNTRNTVSTTPLAGSGHLSLDAALVDVLGDIDISGNDSFVVNVSQDLRFIGALSTEDAESLHGTLNTSADIDIIARQLYPTTLSQFSVNLVNNPGGRISIANSSGSATAAAPVLSAAGSLSFNAAVIEQGGTVKAPLGQLAFNASDSIQLLPGSLTSVSADGAIIPFGETIDSGSSWTYTLNAKKLASELPQKTVELSAPDVAIGSDAMVDLSAGGDAVAWEFVTGPTGKSDVLQDAKGVFAVLPESVNQYAPYDPLLANDTISLGKQVFLSAGSGLAAGYYTLLPARYALLPDAKLVTELTAINGIYPGKTITRADGISVVAGKYAVANSGIIDSRWSAFVVEDGSIARTRSQYIETLASDYFTGHSPSDAGSMTIEVTDSLSLAGKIKGDHADDAMGSRLDILADNIEVVDVAGVASSGFIQLTGDELNQLDVASMMLGGRRLTVEGETAVTVKADNIVIRENAHIVTPELLLVAKNNIEMKSGASLDGSGADSSGVAESYALDNNASMVAVSVNPLAEVTRSGSEAGAEILLAAGSALSADRSIIIDSSKNVQYDGAIDANGGGLRLGANQVNLGDVPLATDGFNLTVATLAGLNVEQLVISSFASLGIYEDVALSFNNLELIAPGFNGISAAGSTVSLIAQGDITLRQNGGVALAGGTGSNTFDMQAANILLAGNDRDFVVAGFENVRFIATQSLQGAGQNGKAPASAAFDFSAADVVLDTPLISGDAGSSMAITTLGAVSLQNSSATVVDSDAVNALGGQFRVDAKTIDVATNLVFPSGLIVLNSSGAAADDNVSLSSSALLDVSGRTVKYVDASIAGSSAGLVGMTSANGNINAQTGSQIDLASSAVAGDAGRLQLSAPNGSITLSSSIETAHAAGFDAAKFSVDVAQLLDISAFMQGVQTAGFSGSQNYRLRNGDIDIVALAGSEASISASEIIIAADNGSINIGGRLDASGEQAGSVAAYASGDVLLEGADIDASASVDDKGGKVIFGTASGVITADSATQIDVAGADNNASGKVTLRAPRTNSNSDVAISEFSTGVSGAERIDIEGVAVYNDSVIGNSQQDIYRSEAQSWLGNSAAMGARLGLTADSRVHYMPGVEVVSSGNVTISNAVDFYQWQLDSSNVIDAGSLTVRAADNLSVNASISDAINAETLTGPTVLILKPGDSWNYRLVGGADLTAANPMAVTRDDKLETGNIQLASGVAVRTGNGDIEISSGGNLVLADQTSVIYTAGQPNEGIYPLDYYDYFGLPDGPQFADNGGDITINVAQDIAGAISDQYFTSWLQRLATVNDLPTPAMWGVVLNDFEQGIATLGGGDITVSAGGNISDLSLSTPRTGQLDISNNVVIRGGGDIDVFAGGDYRSGRILADGGEASIRVLGDMAMDDGVQTVLAMGDARLQIEASGDIGIGGIANVTMLPMSNKQSGSYKSVATNGASGIRNYFFTYGDDSGVELVSHYGDIVIDNDTAAIAAIAATNDELNKPTNLVPDANGFTVWSMYPGDFSATALGGDIQINNSFTLYPDADGNLQLFAGGDILSGDNDILISVLVSDAAVAELPDIYTADYNLTESTLRLFGDTTDQSNRHDFSAPVHDGDPNPVRVVANGDITINDPLKLVLPKKTQVYAGGDITDLAVDIQNLQPTDKSLFIAGGDIRYPVPDSSTSSFVSGGIKVTGPGSIDVIAGGDIDLGISKGIRSLGNVDNSVLPEQGADISVYAGAAAELDSAAFITTYFSGSSEGDAALIDIDVAAYQKQLIAFVQSPGYDGDLGSAVTAVTGINYSDRASAINAFNQLDEMQQVAVAITSFSDSPSVEQRALLLDVLFNEINLAASEQASTGKDEAYARGFLAIDRLFHSADDSDSAGYGGNISLPFSRILSTSGGEINLLAPNGELTVGYTAEVKNASDDAGALGVIVSGKGDLSTLTEGNISVNLARMLTLDGGDISLWSSSGDIDAGRGAKSELTIPPPLTIVDKLTGQIKVIFPPAVSGSGIGAASFSLGQSPGKVTLAAPGGVINASDAGIRSDGDLVLAATKVLGSDNISAGGTSVGIPVATNVTAGLSGLSSSTDSAIKGASESISSATADAAASDGVALVTVELLGTGEEQDQ